MSAGADEPASELVTDCLIAGGGPAGMMLGLLLARAGVDVIVLEKHADFLRDFRGDTIHPSTLDVMDELGLGDDFFKLPHDEVRQLSAVAAGVSTPVGDFTHVPSRRKMLVFMPQWEFLDFLAARARRYRAFRLLMQAEAIDLIRKDNRVVGLLVKMADGVKPIRAALIVAADGRHSTVRARSGLEAIEFGAPMDVLWMRLTRRSDDPGQALGYLGTRKVLVMLGRGSYWQCGLIIPKGSYAEIQRRGLEAFQQDVRACAPFLGDRVRELDDWDAIKLLTVQVDRLRKWSRDGLLCIGDAAHAMSPIGGVGINLAIQDAVAAANLLWRSFRRGSPSPRDLQRVQARRSYPTVMTQALQLAIQKFAIERLFKGGPITSMPLLLRALKAWPVLRRIPARIVGVGFRPEHVRSPDAHKNA